MPDTELLTNQQIAEIELWRKRAQSLIDWESGVFMSVAMEGECYISALLRNIPPAFIVAVCDRAKDANDLQSQLEQLRAENERLTRERNDLRSEVEGHRYMRMFSDTHVGDD